MSYNSSSQTTCRTLFLLSTWNLEEFVNALMINQGVPTNNDKVRDKILHLRQTHSVSNFHTTFITLAAQAEYTDSKLFRDLYYQGIKPDIKKAILKSVPDKPEKDMTFDEYANWTIKIDNRLRNVCYQLGYYPSQLPQPIGYANRQRQYPA